MNKAYEIGFEHGNNYGGTHNYKPGKRKGDTLNQYNAGFRAGQMAHHKSTKNAINLQQ